MRHTKIQNEALKNKIITDACTHYKVTEADLKGRNNKGIVSLARQVVFYLLFNEAGYTHDAIVAMFNREHHNRSSYAQEAIEGILQQPLEDKAKEVIKFFRMHGYCADRYKPYLKLEKKVA
jgi:chromosomal replication initiation ATPase DnaA